MAQDGTNSIPKGLGSLYLSDFWKSLFLAAIVNILLFLYPIINSGEWPTSVDFDSMLKSTVAVIVAYLIKNLSTNNVGQVLQKDKETVKVDVDVLKNLEEKTS